MTHPAELLSAWLDGELAPADVADVQAHLAACAECRAELAAVADARRWVRELPALDLPVVVIERVRRLQTRGAPRIVAAVAGVAAAVAAALFFAAPPSRPAVDPQVGRLVEVHATAGVGADPVSQLVPAAVPVSFGASP